MRDYTIPSWLSRSLRSFLYSSSVYSTYLFLISSAFIRSLPILSFIVPIFGWNVPLTFLIFYVYQLKKKSLICVPTRLGTNFAMKLPIHTPALAPNIRKSWACTAAEEQKFLILKQFALKKPLRNILRKPLVPDTWPWGCQLFSMPSSCPHFHIADTLYSTTPFQNRSNLFLWIWF